MEKSRRYASNEPSKVARKKQPGVVVDDDPPREVDRIDLLDRAFGIGLQTGEDLAQPRRAALFQRRDDGELCDDADGFANGVRRHGCWGLVACEFAFLSNWNMDWLRAEDKTEKDESCVGASYARTGTEAVRSSFPQPTKAPFTARKIAFQIT